MTPEPYNDLRARLEALLAHHAHLLAAQVLTGIGRGLNPDGRGDYSETESRLHEAAIAVEALADFASRWLVLGRPVHRRIATAAERRACGALHVVYFAPDEGHPECGAGARRRSGP